jgi:hypothetical protein
MSDRTGTAEPGHASDQSCGLEPCPGARPVPAAMTRTGQKTSWPLLAHLGPLGALPTAPRVARCLTRVILTTWGIGDSSREGPGYGVADREGPAPRPPSERVHPGCAAGTPGPWSACPASQTPRPQVSRASGH